MRNIPCLDLKGQHEQIKEEVFSAFEQVYSNTAFSGGSFVEKFEKSFAEYLGVSHVVAVNNGTSALHLALMALGVGQGDEVILPSNTFIATAWAVSYVGACPVFVDCLKETWQIDPVLVEKAITKKTKAIIGVHLYGQPCDIDPLVEIARKYELAFVEDAAQAHGALYKGKKTGNFGHLACFSFYPGKNLGACGEGGAIVTNNSSYDKHLRKLRNHGSEQRYYHDELGFNMRMGGLEGSSLSIKLKYLDGWNDRRKKIAGKYLSEIKNPLICFQKHPENFQSVFHLFVVTVEKRDHFMKYLSDNGIFPGLHYPVPCHLQKAYEHLGYKKGDFPNAEYLSAHCLSLPMYAELTDDEVSDVIRIINEYTS